MPSYSQHKRKTYSVYRKKPVLRSANVNVIGDVEKFKKTMGVDPLQVATEFFNPTEAIVRKAQETARKGEKWEPPIEGFCPECKVEEEGPSGNGGGPPPGPPPKIVEIKPPPPRGGEGEDGKKKEKKDENGEGEKKKEEPKPKPPFKPEDIKKAKKGSTDVEQEFEDVTHVRDDQMTAAFQPVTSAADPSLYRDSNFISKMNTALRDWKTGWKEFVGKKGSRLSIPEYIRSRGEEPFVTTLKRSARGRKILVVADFSGSMAGKQEDYKKAIVSSMEVLDSIGTETALYGFGGEIGSNEEFFFKVKRFEEPRWRPNHSAKAAALSATYGSTPTASAYEGLAGYIKKHRPDVTVTISDGEPNGEPDSVERAERMVKELKRNTRMVAFGIGDDAAEASAMARTLKGFGYNSVFSVDNVRDIPLKLVRLMAPESA